MSLAAASAVGLAGGGAALALARRIRGLFWAGVGLAIYPRDMRRTREGRTKSTERTPEGPVLLYVMRDPSVTVSPHVRLAALPLSERILRAALKAGYSRVIVWREENVVKAPVGALFRRGNDWGAFVIEGEQARLVTAELGQRNDEEAQVITGLSPGQTVVLHPPDTLTDGARVTVRATP